MPVIPDNTITSAPLSEAPYAPGLPLIGNTLNMLNDPLSYLVEQYQQLGSVFHLQAGFKKYVVLAGEDANKFLAKDENKLESHTLFGGFAEFVETDVMLTALDGEPHKHLRRLMRPGFSRSAATPHLSTMIEIVREYAQTWQPGQEVPVLEVMRRIVVDQLGEIATHRRPREYFDDILFFINTMLNTEVLKTYPRFVRNLPGFRQSHERLKLLKQEVVDWHRQNPPTNGRARDIIDDLMEGTRPDGEPFSDGDWFNLAVGPYFAGMDTLASTLAFFTYTLHKYPDVLAECKREAAELFASGTPTMEDFRKTEVLHAAALETLRLYPVTPFTPRVVGEAFDFGGYHFPVGTEVMFAQTVTHLLPEYYPDPYTFDINRFKKTSGGRIPNIFTPFSLGTHTCLGAGLAEVQMLVTMAALVHFADLELLTPGFEVKIRTLPLPNPGRDFKIRVKNTHV